MFPLREVGAAPLRGPFHRSLSRRKKDLHAPRVFSRWPQFEPWLRALARCHWIIETFSLVLRLPAGGRLRPGVPGRVCAELLPGPARGARGRAVSRADGRLPKSSGLQVNCRGSAPTARASHASPVSRPVAPGAGSPASSRQSRVTVIACGAREPRRAGELSVGRPAPLPARSVSERLVQNVPLGHRHVSLCCSL